MARVSGGSAAVVSAAAPPATADAKNRPLRRRSQGTGLAAIGSGCSRIGVDPDPYAGEQHSSPEGPGSCVKVRGIPSARLTQRGNRRDRNKDTARVICRAANFNPGRDLGLDHLPQRGISPALALIVEALQSGGAGLQQPAPHRTSARALRGGDPALETGAKKTPENKAE
jgi:hypothetical protein